MAKRVLFFRPRKATDFNPVPQLGLGIFTRILRAAGHEVLVCDHLLFVGGEAPSVEELLASFEPDVVGITIFTSTAGAGKRIAARVRAARPEIPILAGGPHASIYTDRLATDPNLDYVVTGEADDIILDLIDRAERQSAPLVVRAEAPKLLSLPFADFSSFLALEAIEQYPLQTGRGCPFKCNFCAVPIVSTKKWRGRDPEACVQEVLSAKKMLPNLKSVKVVDDVPTINLKHFKAFLRAYLAADVGLPIHVDNVRADEVDEEFLSLAKQAGVTRICLAVEHGHPEVLKLVDKGETHDEMRYAAKLIHQQGLELECCFVVGLPLDSVERTDASIAFAKELGAKYIFWNMAHPMPGTTMFRWFEEHGATFYPDDDYTSFDFRTLRCPEPVVETPDFSRLERKKAYFKAVLATDQFDIRRDFREFAKRTFEYGLWRQAATAIGRRLRRRVDRLVHSPSPPDVKPSWGMDAPVETVERTDTGTPVAARVAPSNGRSF